MAVPAAPARKSFSESTVVRSASKGSLDKEDGEEAVDEVEEEKKRSFTSEGGWRGGGGEL